jgi:hypothetical protein
MNDTKNRASFLASLTRATKKSKAGGVAAKKNCKAHHLRQKNQKLDSFLSFRSTKTKQLALLL